MSYTIATSIKIDKEVNFTGRGGANNVIPFYTYPFNWDDKERVMYDILSGSVQIDGIKSKLADSIREAIKKVKAIHSEKYGKLQDVYPYGSKSINPFSLYTIGGIYFQSKDGHDKPSEIDYSIYSEQYRDQIKNERDIISHNWNEYATFYKELLNVFFNTVASPIQ